MRSDVFELGNRDALVAGMEKELDHQDYCWMCGIPWILHNSVRCSAMKVPSSVYEQGRYAPHRSGSKGV